MDAVDRVIDQLYDGATDAAAWPGAMSSLCTARNHLKAIFRKTHTRRQAELVSLILRLARFGD